jgi:3-hydroxymyristoyl/3-hydroxydecanoyl-(acyl carrier protein) dehydratase
MGAGLPPRAGVAGLRARPMRLLYPSAVQRSNGPLGARIHTTFCVPAEAPVFSGHYPHHPVLPGVFLVEAALQALEPAVGRYGADWSVLAVRQLRLQGAVAPGMPVRLEAVAGEDGEDGATSWQCTFSHEERCLARCVLVLGPAAAGGAAQDDAGLPEAPPGEGQRLDSAAIVRRLAHRAPMLLVDGAEVGAGGETLHAYKAVSLNESSFGALDACGHAGQFAYPACLVMESFIQACALLVAEKRVLVPGTDVMLLGGVREFRMSGQVYAGQCLRHEVRLLRYVADTALFDGRSYTAEGEVGRFREVLVAVRPAVQVRAIPVCA